jgi:RNA-directed DNA polymerase
MADEVRRAPDRGPRVVRHIQKWLNAGVMEEGKRVEAGRRNAAGREHLPLLANIYLHYVFDLWADQWRKTQAHGEVIIVRYADDFVVGFQHESDARRFLEELRERFRKFNLELHAEKTRVIEFGRFAPNDENAVAKASPRLSTFWASRTCATRPGRMESSSCFGRRWQSGCTQSSRAERALRRACTIRLPKWADGWPQVLAATTGTYGVPRNYPALDDSATGATALASRPEPAEPEGVTSPNRE